MLSRFLARNIQSTTGKNLQYIQEETGLSPWSAPRRGLRDALVAGEVAEVLPQDRWRLPYLGSLLSQRREARKLALEEEEKRLTKLIDSLVAN